ncbi:hypothetical protein AOL_s00004g468 [Orbilia oligospora ATCC 24927]|uniref:Class E vacuolar protein-sorting machinery protein HSE1 n=1 Tax=Arthrobotrys oligospora (strain ATCC 24927 / CBS 115.81 / DSM 1491) TaxID=756982 RepID=G1WYV7_ARTOA|nr:hypothetical protein AOL_s00004g468 [Orbilia oligospora ATCC 24927]EGX53809.1 hypothetical protein AOL_s00004g468 [Orbilia oligospora ATCC 24927]
MMVMSSQTAHFPSNGGQQRQAAQVPRGRLLNGNGSFSEGRRPRSSNPVAPAHSPSPPAMFVRALYNYAADDPTSLSFHQGDVIQVLTQLESGWWDGIVNGQRGWFPSNYCALVPNSDLNGDENSGTQLEGADEDAEGQDYEDYEDTESDESDGDGQGRGSPQLPLEGQDHDDEAAFWLPQVTPDGRLYYFNTLTGASRTELPLETPISSTESGPRLRTEFAAPDSTRPPPELMAAGLTTDEATNGVDHDDGADNESQGDGEMLMFAVHSPVRETNNATTPDRTSAQSGKANGQRAGDEPILNRELFGGNTAGYDINAENEDAKLDTVTFHDDILPIPASWDALIEETQHAIARYRQAIMQRQRMQYVSRAEDISDMLRLIIGAGSSTTDNHSGQPTIISSNKALHPHFRHFMAAFSKLVLSSHVASTDWPPADAEAKCLAEADEVMTGVLEFAKVARAQKDDVVPRLGPGFVVGSHIGGSWFSNGLGNPNSKQSVIFGERDSLSVATTPIDSQLVESLRGLQAVVVPGLRTLEDALETPGPVTTVHQQNVVGAFVIHAAQTSMESMRAYFHFLESINLAPLASGGRSPTLLDFAITKQRLYDSFADLFMAVQYVTAELADEWTSFQGLPLEDRLSEVRSYIREIQQGIQSLVFTAEHLVEEFNERAAKAPTEDGHKPSQSSPSTAKAANGGKTPVQAIPTRGRAGSTVGGPLILQNSDKIRRILGDTPLEKGVPAKEEPSPQEKVPEPDPWFLAPEVEDENEIQYADKEKATIRGGKLELLVVNLTRHDSLDADFNNTFLLTYKSFTTASHLFDLLTDRFNIQPPNNLNTAEYKLWAERKQKPIRLRVLNILKSWFENFWMEPRGEAETEILQRVLDFATAVMAPSFPGANVLKKLVEMRIQGRDPAFERVMIRTDGAKPAPIYPKNMRKLKFLDIDPLEFARQLTIIESKAYTKIKATECLGKAWSKPAPSDSSPDPAENVKAMILNSNQLTNWVAEMILNQPEVKKRVVVIKHFISVAEKCRYLNNFSTLTAIISALSTSPIHRLKRTWEQVPTRTIGILESMRTLMGTTRNFGDYREMLHLVNPPCVPFLGVYLTDLTFIEDGNPDLIKSTDLINFAKRAKTAEVIREIQQYQSVPYALEAVKPLQEYILSNMQAAKDVHEMYEVSIQIEPREREDEKIARLLQESGFL